MKQSMRFFAIGLLTASVVLLGFYFILNGSQASSKDIPLEEMIEQIESSGHRVITEKEFIAYTISNEEKTSDENKDDKKKEDDKDEKKQDKDKDTKDKDKKKDDKKKDKVIKAKFTTKDGVVTQDIADILVEKKIIDDRQKFLDYLEDNDYSPYIQVGTFEVNSDMSMKELAEVITTYPGN